MANFNVLRRHFASNRTFGLWMMVASIGLLASSCATLQNRDVGKAEFAEYRGRSEDAFWTYHNAAFFTKDRREAQRLFLRAYRCTGVDLTGAPSAHPENLNTALFGALADLHADRNAHTHAEELDAVTPLPGTRLLMKRTLTPEESYRRSMAAYNWARMTGLLGEFEQAETAFLYSLKLEEPKHTMWAPSRHFELGRMYYAWGKMDQSAQEFRAGLKLIENQQHRLSDPIGLATVLDEFALALAASGQAQEAVTVGEQSEALRKANPGKVAIFHPDVYPKRPSGQ